MGLDLLMYKRSSYDKYIESDNFMDLEPEMMYGRKTWSLYEFFKNSIGSIDLGDEAYAIDKSAFEEFEEILAPYADFLASTLDDEFDEDANYKKIHKIYNKISGVPASLGEDWDVRAFARWYAALPEVYRVYDEGDSLVMIASY